MKSAQGQLDAAEGKLQLIETMIDELIIRSPREAQVETLDLRPGDILADEPRWPPSSPRLHRAVREDLRA